MSPSKEEMKERILTELIRSVYAQYYEPKQLLEYADQMVKFVSEDN